MAYDFHYTPTGTGVISGKEVLEQTEDAINDLGNTAISGVQEALDKAEQALTNSENAVDDAQTALNTANNAEGVAIQAQTDVGNLSGTVTNIGNRVTTAEGNISNLQGRMTTAEGNITNLQGRMTTAETNIGNLQTAVSTAQATANSAQQTATTARQQSYVFRYSSTALTPSSTNSNTLLDNTDNLKVGDKVIDSSGVLFSITAIDTANSTFTIGTALIDLAQDSDVVHKSGDETILGQKTFENNKMVVGRATDGTSVIQFVNSDVVGDSANGSSGFEVYGSSISDANKIGSITIGEFSNNGGSYATIECNRTFSGVKSSNAIRSLIRPNGLKELSATVDNDCKLGTEFLRWSKIYGTEYYYGSNNIEFSTKFVTTDTAQTISGNKTFSSNVNVYNSDSATDTANIILKNSKAERGSTTNIGEQNISFVDKDNAQIGNIKCEVDASGVSVFTLNCTNSSNSSSGIRLRRTSTGTFLQPTFNNGCNLGTSGYRWYDTQTRAINGVEPSSLGMPVIDRTKYVDISGYFTNTGNGDINTYSVTANGWIYLRLTDIGGCQLSVLDSSNNRLYGSTSSGNLEQLCLPVTAGTVVETQWTTSTSVTVAIARFIPCQGNI